MARLMSAALLLAGIAACGGSDDSIEEPEKPKPDVPVDNGDWHTVKAAGGTIEVGDITLQFASSTFANEVKVGVTEVKASDITEDGRSKFYKLTLPESGNLKPFTVKLKCNGSTENVRPLVKTLAWDPHSGRTSLVVFDINATVSNGEIVATIPVLSSDGTEKPYFTIGLAECPPLEDVAQTRAESQFSFEYRTGVSVEEYYKNKVNFRKTSELVKKVIPEAANLLKQQGFNIGTKVSYILSSPEKVADLKYCWGIHKPAYYGKEWNVVYLNQVEFFKYLSDPKDFNLNDIKATIIHETLHAITNVLYDPRWAYTICKAGAAGDDWAQFDEALGSWVEKFIGAKTFGDNTVKNQKNFIHEFFPHNRSMENCKIWGYGMASFIEYVALKVGDKEIVKIDNAFKESGGQFKDVLHDFLTEEKIKFFDPLSYYDFAFSVLNAKVIPKIDIENCVITKVEDSPDIMKEKEYNIGGDVYNYGVLVNKIVINPAILRDHADSLIQVTQDKPDVLTRVYYKNASGLQLIGQCSKWEEVKIKADELAKEYGINLKNGDSGSIALYLTTTRNEFKDDNSSLPSDITVKIVSDKSLVVTPDILHFYEEGGSKQVTVKKEGYKYHGAWAEDDCKSWVDITTTDGGLSITVKPNHTTQERKGFIVVYATNDNKKPTSTADLEYNAYEFVHITQDAGHEQSPTANYQLIDCEVTMNIYTGVWTYGYDSMSGILFTPSDDFVTITPQGKGLHIDINYEKEENKYKTSLKCQFDLDDLTLMESRESKISNLSWKMDTDNQSGGGWQGTWGWYADIKHQTQKIRFATSSPIPQFGFDKDGKEKRSVMWYVETPDLSSSECSYVRTTYLNDGEGNPVTDVEEGKEMLDGSHIIINMNFKYVSE